MALQRGSRVSPPADRVVAIEALIQAGLVEEESGQQYVVTERGRRVLAMDE